MKKRLGFVSNSSSCSFTCDVCGYTEDGYDRDIGEIFFECKNGHQICIEHMINRKDFLENCNDYGYTPAKYCPICSMNDFNDNDILLYLIKEFGYNRSEIKEEIRERFENYTEFTKFLKDE